MRSTVKNSSKAQDDNDSDENISLHEKEKSSDIEDIDLEERKMSLKEREVALRKAIAEAEAIELANKKTKLALEKEE